MADGNSNVTQIADALSAMSLFEGLEVETVHSFAKDLSLSWVSPGQTVVEQGEKTDDVHFVLSGRLLGLLMSAQGREVSYTEIKAGHYFGELSALDGRPRSITVSAANKTQLGTLPAAAFRKWMAREPQIAHNLTIDLAERNRRLTERVFELVVHDVDKRVRVMLSRMAQDNQQLKNGGVLEPSPTHDGIATYIGATREAVSRVMARLSSEGAIKTERRRITFLDLDMFLGNI